MQARLQLPETLQFRARRGSAISTANMAVASAHGKLRAALAALDSFKMRAAYFRRPPEFGTHIRIVNATSHFWGSSTVLFGTLSTKNGQSLNLLDLGTCA